MSVVCCFFSAGRIASRGVEMNLKPPRREPEWKAQHYCDVPQNAQKESLAGIEASSVLSPISH
jgi:hypothetical protein